MSSIVIRLIDKKLRFNVDGVPVMLRLASMGRIELKRSAAMTLPTT